MGGLPLEPPWIVLYNKSIYLRYYIVKDHSDQVFVSRTVLLNVEKMNF